MKIKEISKIFHDQNDFQMQDFEIIEEIGRGAFSVVFEAWKTKNDEPCALKIINFESLDKEHIKLLWKEIEIHWDLNHELVI